MFAHQLTIADLTKRAAPLALLGMALACERTPTAPEQAPKLPPVVIETSVLPVLAGPADFDASQYFGINVQLAAQQQYGPAATAVQVSGHLYGWRAQLRGQQFSIDMARAVRDQFGAGYVLGAVGVGIYDWRAVHWSALSHQVLPVMVIASDYFYDVGSVTSGLASLKSVLLTTRNWYQLRAGRTFRLLQPLVVFNQSAYSAAQWNGFSTYAGGGSEMLWDFAWNAYAGVYPSATLGSGGAALRVLLSPFTGTSPTLFDGGFAQYTMIGGGIVKAFASAPPAASSLTCSWGTGGDGLLYDLPCERATFWVAHELALTFGLQDCALNSPYDCWDSIMAVAGTPPGTVGPLPPATVLTPPQIATLLASGFFF